MATNIPIFISLLLLLLLSTQVHPKHLPNSPYLTPQKALFQDFQKMLITFKIYTYPPPNSFFNFSTPSESHFHTSLLKSPFRTVEPTQAHLFLVPFPQETSSRALSRYIKEIRTKFPYWDRSLGADHFFISRDGISYSSNRNTLELKKNSIQISVFPTLSGNFVPHKDISLASFSPNPPPRALSQAHEDTNATFLTFLDQKSQTLFPGFTKELVKDHDFVTVSGSLDLSNGKYCVFFYGGDVSRLGEALATGCVPVVITDRPIQDLPLMDVLRWSDLAVFVAVGNGVEGVKRVVSEISEDRYAYMRGLGVEAAQHLVWNAEAQDLDAFRMVMYQLWTRRHTIRYVQREAI